MVAERMLWEEGWWLGSLTLLSGVAGFLVEDFPLPYEVSEDTELRPMAPLILFPLSLIAIGDLSSSSGS